jgi:hypothetical protein
LYATGTIAAVVGLSFVLIDAETTLLLFFMIGVFYPLAAAFLIPSFFIAGRAIRTRSLPLAVAALAALAYVGLWSYALLWDLSSYSDPIVTVIWVASLLYAGAAFWLAAKLQRTNTIAPQ